MKVPEDPMYLRTAASEEEYWEDMTPKGRYIVDLGSQHKYLHFSRPGWKRCAHGRQAFPRYLKFETLDEVKAYERKNRVKLGRCGKCFPRRVWMKRGSQR